ncbi:aminotransferase class-III [Kockovaella imperatae]|uniref:Aminotransferase class-III n=1 Tax=Kockovaella imperatae TaxID=4999 RepID=A0A1Y1UFG5_9TREE|nr:aminotransferase class-III [Kockovaella imperatae]ORX36244.1 aminotransferase class-III [Kockovaella imperatae]
MSPIRVEERPPSSLLYRDLKGQLPDIVVEAKGSYLYLKNGARILDGCAGAGVASIGHGNERVINAVADQLRTLSYHHTSRMTSPVAEALGRKLVGHKPGGLSHAIFLSSGSEANESAIKLVRQYFVEIGKPQRQHIISRNNSYHGNSVGCVSLTGLPSRRRHFAPMLMPHVSQVSPCYPYRQQGADESDQAYAQRLADELEQEILRVGEDSVAAFFVETLGGTAAGNLVAVPGYFKAVREVCDKYQVLLVLDEIMCGMGRTGKLHAWEWEGVSPDIQTIGKGLNGGYQALSAVLINERVVDGLRQGSGAFANGQTFQCHPAAAAAGLEVLKIFEEEDVVNTALKRGAELRSLLIQELGSHPNVGDIRGRGLFQSLEFVANKETKETLPANIPISMLLDNAIFERGALIYSGFGKGTADGYRGDHILMAPPLNISSAEVKELVDAIKGGVEEVFSRPEVVAATRAAVASQ